ncbi:MAG: YkgJ family cysteine cluster protein [Promethearchaeota archaeon]
MEHKKTFKKSSSLRFECQNCGKCCTSSKIIVTLLHSDIPPLLKCFGSIEELLPSLAFFLLTEKTNHFKSQMMVPPFDTARGQAYLGLNKRDSECIFYNSQECSIHPYRPLACRNFPLGLGMKGGKRVISVLKAKEIGCQGIGKGERMMRVMLCQLFTHTTEDLKDFHQFVKEVNKEQKIRGYFSLQEILALMVLYANQKDKESTVLEIETV